VVRPPLPASMFSTTGYPRDLERNPGLRSTRRRIGGPLAYTRPDMFLPESSCCRCGGRIYTNYPNLSSASSPMGHQPPTRWSMPSLAALALLLLAGWTPSSYASCGDYVHILPAKAGGHDSPQVGGQPPTSQPPKLPCQGPGCRRAPDRQQTPSPPPATSTPQHDALLVAPAADECAVGGFSLLEPSHSLYHFPTYLFRPPRP
jgi:hypothetical protein